MDRLSRPVNHPFSFSSTDVVVAAARQSVYVARSVLTACVQQFLDPLCSFSDLVKLGHPSLSFISDPVNLDSFVITVEKIYIINLFFLHGFTLQV
jgi:hypothetical protein